MAVDPRTPQPGAPASRGRRLLVGTNVLVAFLLVVGIVAVLQLFAYKAAARWDMTSSGINSLSDGTERLLRGLDTNVRLTSLYFETDLEEEDQQRYRVVIDDLLGLYASTNRSRVTSEGINPLSDHEKLKKLVSRLREKTRFKKAIEDYAARIERYRGEAEGLDIQMNSLVKSELELVDSLGAAGVGEGFEAGSTAQTAVAPVENVFRQWTSELAAVREQVDALMPVDNPQYATVVHELRSVYDRFGKSLKDVTQYGKAEVSRNPTVPAEQARYLREAGNRYASLVAAIEGETTALQELEPLEIDDLLRKLTPNGNPLVIETSDDALVVDFSSIWPPHDPHAGGRRIGFKDRGFKGEEKLTSAILRVTHEEQTAVVFVRYGGQPLFLGGFMPGQPPAPLASMKQQLEDVNFILREWDLKTSEEPPKIDPEPTRTIYVVLKPTAPPRDPMGRPSQEPPFTDSHKRLILDAIGNSGRALFMAGWYPGPFGAIPSTYEYNDFLQETWGIGVDTSTLLIATASTGPGKYNVGRRDFYAMRDLRVGDHDVVSAAHARLLYLPWCAPLELSDSPPEGVKYTRLVVQESRDGLWGVKNIQAYQEQLQQRNYLTKAEGDLEGPFDLAVAATKDDAKVVVVGARDFAVDQVAFARELRMSAQGFTLAARNPGNVTLLINSLHWLNDNTEFMNIGKPIDAAVLEIESDATVWRVQILTIFVWPVVALLAGGMVWWVRRR